jgi:GNAT superfamily N-acetyltransferase
MNLNFQTATNISYNHIIEKIEHLTFPPIRKKVQTMTLTEPYTGIWALSENKIVGIILADKPLDRYPELFSFYVVPEARNKGIGNQLLTLLETSLKSQGLTGVQSRYRNDWKSVDVIERMLESHQWEKPQTVRIIAEAGIEKYLEAPWPAVKMPGDYHIESWEKLQDSERRRIEELIRNNEVPREFSPFQHEEKNFNKVSTYLKYRNEIAGWNIVFELKPDTLEYNNLFLVANYRKMGYAISLLKDSFGRQFELHIPKATWIINAENKAILKIAQLLAGKQLNKYVEVKGSRKIL